ncbi:MAG: hypothetical protein K8W52_18535 [Deltaproteobacteria bacterium]|nr:hypothetical protein [Deltaproteobacteria bacterium]
MDTATVEEAVTTTPASAAPGAKPFTTFESGQVRPLAMSADGKWLFATNTPDNRLEIFRITAGGLEHRESVPVGLEPVAVAVRGNSEVWVVNHLSDSVSIVDVEPVAGSHVVRTLLVGDEPRDIVFAGPGKNRAFITTAHRGQNAGFDPQLTTPGIGRADVWVFDATNLGTSLGGTPLTRVNLFADTPRALAVSADGTQVYAAAFESGNRTTVVDENLVTANGGLPGPRTNLAGEAQPNAGLIVKFDGSAWLDELGRSWNAFVNFTLPDKDVFVINASANPPVQTAAIAGVGTVLYNMAVNPVNGKVYVTNTEALNQNRFEGTGVNAGHTGRGNFIRNRISVLSSGTVSTRHLNKHINYAAPFAAVPNSENSRSVALPTGVAVTANGTTMYVAALGSSKVAIYRTAELEADTFVPQTSDQIPVSGGGPTGLVLDEARARMYVLTRFDNSISIVNTTTKAETGHVAMYNPEPAKVVTGRRFMYDAAHTSSRGDSACASCHVFGDFDSLAWDLGDPDAMNAPMPTCASPTDPCLGVFPSTFPGFPGPPSLRPPFFGQAEAFAALKGPMTTQSLRGMANHGPMHWRGDRTGGSVGAPGAQPDTGMFDEQEAFGKFRVAFVGLLGRDALLPETEVQQFADFALTMTYPPNPIRSLDNSLNAEQQAGRDLYFSLPNDVAGPCASCHVLDPLGNAQYGVESPGFFGSDGRFSALPLPQAFKMPQLRNMYQKVGMFGMAANPVFDFHNPPFFSFTGDQVRGFGYLHDGSHDTLFRFHARDTSSQNSFLGFNPGGFADGEAGDAPRRALESFLLAYDSNLAPIVGQDITLTATNGAVANARIDLLRARAEAGECDLVAKGSALGFEVGFLYIGAGQFTRNRVALAPISDTALRSWVASSGHELTYTCVPPGAGERVGIDRDLDGARDGDEVLAGTDPADPSSHP